MLGNKVLTISAVICVQVQTVMVMQWYDCRTFDVKSSTPTDENSYEIINANGWRQSMCCEPEYPVIYSYAECPYVTFSTRQTLKIPDNATHLKYIVFKNSNISILPVNVFTTFSNLTQIYLNNSKINTIQPGAFTGLTMLKELHLENNNITEITKDVFNSLTSLELLDISNNEIGNIEENTFLGLFYLEKLNLSHNKLKTLGSAVFKGLSKIDYLDLSDNNLFEISFGLFTDIIESSHELTLDISNNYLCMIDFSYFPSFTCNLNLANNPITEIKNFTSLSNMKLLDLSDNHLANISIFNNNLHYFNLSGNEISFLNESLFNESYNLHTLDLRGNLLNDLNENLFGNLYNLVSLYLQNNQISNVPVGCFRDLQLLNILNLSSNKIEEFDYGTFFGLQSLTTLDISNNRLSYLLESLFHPLPNLQNLYICNNVLTTFDSRELLQYTKLLRVVSLDNNLWNCNALQRIINDFEAKYVVVSQGSIKKAKNINGIACSDRDKVNGSVDKLFSHYGTRNNNSDDYIEIFVEILNELKQIQKAVANKHIDLLSYSKINSNNIEKYFINSLFYKYSKQEFIMNNTFVSNLNKSILDFSKDTLNLDIILYFFLRKLSLERNFTNFFGKDFKKGSFIDYIQKDFFNSHFFKYFNKNSSTAETSNGAEFLHNFFNHDFKNSTFYQFFEDISNRYSKELASKEDKDIEFARYIDNSYSKDKILDKISELQSVITTLMIIIILILICKFLLIVVKRIPDIFIRKVKYDIKKDIGNKNKSTAGQEMV